METMKTITVTVTAMIAKTVGTKNLKDIGLSGINGRLTGV
jgi:hypothetical protein